MISPIALFALRQNMMSLAIQTSEEGDSPDAVIARAKAYEAHVLAPMGDDFAILADAMAERLTATVH